MAKSVKLSVVALPRPSNKTPNASTELKMMRAGLGKRCALIPEDADHSEVQPSLIIFYINWNAFNPYLHSYIQIRAIFEMEFPKLESLNGDWLFYKATGRGVKLPQTVLSVAVWQTLPQHPGKNKKIRRQFLPAGSETVKQLNC